MLPVLEIAGRKIGTGHPPYVVCELSGNHNGNLDRALQLIDAAAATGADAIKIQTYTPDTLTIDSDRPEFKLKGGLWDNKTLYELYGEAQTPYEWHPALFARAKAHGVTLFSTPFDETAIDLLASLDAPAYKIASFEAIDLSLIERVARQRKPMIISTGMANLAEIQDAVTAARDAGAPGIALLHCTSAYPAPVTDANVRTIPHLASAFGVVGGLSDHTPGTAVAVAAIALGACIIEKHFTLSRTDGGPDAAFSLEPEEFKRLVDDCRAAWSALGDITYDLQGSERGNKAFRRSIYAVATIEAGEAFSTQNVRSIRPGFGLPPKALPGLIGRRARRRIERGEPIVSSLVE
jgi:N-acetylneuraminate synthase